MNPCRFTDARDTTRCRAADLREGSGAGRLALLTVLASADAS
eukprot:gene1189-101_t